MPLQSLRLADRSRGRTWPLATAGCLHRSGWIGNRQRNQADPAVHYPATSERRYLVVQMGSRPAASAGEGAGSDHVGLPADGRALVATSHGPAARFMYDDDHGERLVVLTRPMSSANQNAPITPQSQGDVGGFAWADDGWASVWLDTRGRLQMKFGGRLVRSERYARFRLCSSRNLE